MLVQMDSKNNAWCGMQNLCDIEVIIVLSNAMVQKLLYDFAKTNALKERTFWPFDVDEHDTWQPSVLETFYALKYRYWSYEMIDSM